MNVFVRLKNLLKKNKGKYEIWDTSAVSVWLDRLIATLNSESKITVIIPEGVVHELSAGRRNYDRCKKAYEYITTCKSSKLKIEVTEDSHRAWTIDEQIVATAEKYYKKGYKAVLITCDKDEAYKAGLKGIESEVLYTKKQGGKEKSQKILRTTQTVIKKEPKKEPEIAVEGENITIPCIVINKGKYINLIRGIEVYSPNGKRKIAKDNMLPVCLYDKVIFMDIEYTISQITDTYISLKKVV